MVMTKHVTVYLKWLFLCRLYYCYKSLYHFYGELPFCMTVYQYFCHAANDRLRFTNILFGKSGLVILGILTPGPSLYMNILIFIIMHKIQKHITLYYNKNAYLPFANIYRGNRFQSFHIDPKPYT